jgi:hypothetical protein
MDRQKPQQPRSSNLDEPIAGTNPNLESFAVWSRKRQQSQEPSSQEPDSQTTPNQ